MTDEEIKELKKEILKRMFEHLYNSLGEIQMNNLQNQWNLVSMTLEFDVDQLETSIEIANQTLVNTIKNSLMNSAWQYADRVKSNDVAVEEKFPAIFDVFCFFGKENADSKSTSLGVMIKYKIKNMYCFEEFVKEYISDKYPEILSTDDKKKYAIKEK